MMRADGWRDVAATDFSDPARGPNGPCDLSYHMDYVLEQQGGFVAWDGAAASLRACADPDKLMTQLRDFAAELRHLPELLGDLGLPDETFEAINLVATSERLERWGLM